MAEIKPEQVPSEAIRKAMHEFLLRMNDDTETGEAWSLIIAAALNAWPGMKHSRLFPSEWYIILPLPTETD